MDARYNNNFGEFLQTLFDKHGITSPRQARARVNVAHTTLTDILGGRQPSVETTLRIAKGFNLDVAEALRKAGHEDVAAMWEMGVAHREEKTDSVLILREPHETYQRNHEDDIQEWLGRMGKKLAVIPPGREREALKEKLLNDTESQVRFVQRLAEADENTPGKKAE